MLGLSLGLYMLIRRELFNDWPSAYAISAHTRAVFVGFVMFMILGVALYVWTMWYPIRASARQIREDRGELENGFFSVAAPIMLAPKADMLCG